MAIEIVMPQMGESVIEGTVAKWLVKEGDVVREGQPLLEISTDKVDTEIPAPTDGVVAKILVREGETLPVGARLAILEPKSSAPQPTPPQPKTKDTFESVVTGSEPPANLNVGVSGPTAGPTEPVQPSSKPTTEGEARRVPFHEQPQPEQSAVEHQEQPRRWSPVVMRMAAEYGLDLSKIPGSGIGGRVTKRDVLNYLESLQREQSQPATSPKTPHPETDEAAKGIEAPQTSSVEPAPARQPIYTVFRPPTYQPQEGDIVEPFSRRRKIIAEHMVYSKTHAPHVGIVARVDMTKLVRFREAHKEAFRAREGFQLTFLPMVAMAAVRALKEFPRMNASVVGDSLVIRKQINLGIAVDSDEGLVVPVIKSADQKSLLGLAREIEEMRRKTLEGRLTPDDLAGGSFTVSNPGREGNLFGFAIINQPQVAILRMGEIRKEPVVVEVDGEDTIAIRSVMYLTCSYDHRVIDGVLGNRFLYRVARILETAEFEL